MQFTVTYRGADGAVVTEAVEAASRGECFAQMKSRGISPMRVEKGKGKQPSHTKTQGRGGGGALKWVLAVAVVLALVGGLLWWFAGHEVAVPKDGGPKKPGALAKEVTPATNAVRNAGKEGLVGKEEPQSLQDGLTNGAAASPTTTNLQKSAKKNYRIVRHPSAHKKSIFKEKSDQRIARLLSVEPGGFLIGTFTYNGFKEQFLKSLRTPIEITDDDSPRDVAMKQAVLETRADLKARLDAGEDIEKVMEDTEKELRRLSNYRLDLIKHINQAKKEGKFSSADMKDYVEAANMLLKEKGIKPLSHPEMFYRNIKVQGAPEATVKEKAQD